jgi:dolichol-phosphate mannosyltransferase
MVVDDGSTEGSGELADEFHDEDARWKCVHLSRNSGHQAVVTAGLHHARGDVTCVMDADLQDPPEVLLQLLAEWEKGNDVVYGVRRERKEHRLKVALYDLFYRLFARLSSVPMPLDAGDFSLLSRPALDALNRLPEKERFVRGLRAWIGFRQTGVVYERQARAGGSSKYGLAGLARLAPRARRAGSDAGGARARRRFPTASRRREPSRRARRPGGRRGGARAAPSPHRRCARARRTR